MTSTVLPYQNKLSGNYSKKVSFRNSIVAGHNQYIRKLGKGFACIEVEYSLKYVGLTSAELTAVETLFGYHDIEEFLAWQAPIDLDPMNFRKPKSWARENYLEVTSPLGAAKESKTNLSFTIKSFTKGVALFVTPPPLPLPLLPSTFSVSASHIDNIVYYNSRLYLLAYQNVLFEYNLLTDVETTLSEYGGSKAKLFSDTLSTGEFWMTSWWGALSKLDNTTIPYGIEYILPSALHVFGCTNSTYLFSMPGNIINKVNKVTGTILATIDNYTGHFGRIMVANETDVYFIRSTLEDLSPFYLMKVDIATFTPETLLTLDITSPARSCVLVLTSTHLWITAKPNKLFRVSLADDSLTAFEVTGYTTLDNEPGLEAYLTYVPELDLLVVSCGDEGVVKYINQDATDSSNIINQTITTSSQPMQVTYNPDNNALYVTSWGGSAITKIS